MKKEKTFEAKIYLGSMNNNTGQYVTQDKVENIINDYVNAITWCITITETKFMYVDGNEEGWIIGIIQNPRFPESENALRNKTLELADILLKKCFQERVSVVFPDETIMLENIINE